MCVFLLPNLGLSENVNYEELQRLQKVTQNTFKNVSFNPVTILATQLTKSQDATNLQIRLKMSAYERDLAIFLTQHKDTHKDVDDLL